MNRRKANVVVREKGLPHRKSIAGPTVLSSITAPGAIKKSIAYDTIGLGQGAQRSIVSDHEELENLGIAFAKPVQKDYESIDGRIKILNIINVDKEILCCKYNEEFNFLAVGCSDGAINIYKSDSCDYQDTLMDEDLMVSTAPVTAIQHRPVSRTYPISNCFTCTYANGFVKCWNYHFKQCLYTIKESRECFGITYHPRYPKFVTYGDDSKIYLYDEETKTQERVLSSSNNPGVIDGHTSRVFAACFNPRSNYELLTGGWDDVVHFWDLRAPHSVRHLSGMHICGEGIDINKTGTEVITCGFQKKKPFQVWDYASGNLIATVEGEEMSKLYVGRYISKDYAICGGAAPNGFHVIDLSTNTVNAAVLGLPSAVYSMDVGLPKKVKENTPAHRIDPFALIPHVAFVSGRKLYQLDFYQ